MRDLKSSNKRQDVFVRIKVPGKDDKGLINLIQSNLPEESRSVRISISEENSNFSEK